MRRLVRKYRLVRDGDRFHIASGPVLCNLFTMGIHTEFHLERMGDIDEQDPLAKKDSFNPLEMRILCAKLGRSICTDCLRVFYSDCEQLPKANTADSSYIYGFLENGETGEIHLIEFPFDKEEVALGDLSENMDDWGNVGSICQKFRLPDGEVIEEFLDGEKRSIFNEEESRIIAAKLGRRLCGVCASHLYRT